MNHPLIESHPNGVFPVLEVAKAIGQEATNLRRKAAAMNGQVNFNAESDTLNLSQLKEILPTYLTGQRQLKGSKRDAVRKLLAAIDGNVEEPISRSVNSAKRESFNKTNPPSTQRTNESNKPVKSWTTRFKSIGYAFRDVAPILPLPMLGLAASYGVFHFAKHFVPTWVAVIEASGFELVYIGLAASLRLPPSVRKYAQNVSIGAVSTSVIYNVLAGALALDETLFDGLTPFFFWLISAIHGAPLAVLAYFVADLNLHKRN